MFPPPPPPPPPSPVVSRPPVSFPPAPPTANDFHTLAMRGAPGGSLAACAPAVSARQQPYQYQEGDKWHGSNWQQAPKVAVLGTPSVPCSVPVYYTPSRSPIVRPVPSTEDVNDVGLGTEKEGHEAYEEDAGDVTSSEGHSASEEGVVSEAEDGVISEDSDTGDGPRQAANTLLPAATTAENPVALPPVTTGLIERPLRSDQNGLERQQNGPRASELGQCSMPKVLKVPTPMLAESSDGEQHGFCGSSPLPPGIVYMTPPIPGISRPHPQGTNASIVQPPVEAPRMFQQHLLPAALPAQLHQLSGLNPQQSQFQVQQPMQPLIVMMQPDSNGGQQLMPVIMMPSQGGYVLAPAGAGHPRHPQQPMTVVANGAHPIGVMPQQQPQAGQSGFAQPASFLSHLPPGSVAPQQSWPQAFEPRSQVMFHPHQEIPSNLVPTQPPRPPPPSSTFDQHGVAPRVLQAPKIQSTNYQNYQPQRMPVVVKPPSQSQAFPQRHQVLGSSPSLPGLAGEGISQLPHSPVPSFRVFGSQPSGQRESVLQQITPEPPLQQPPSLVTMIPTRDRLPPPPPPPPPLIMQLPSPRANQFGALKRSSFYCEVCEIDLRAKERFDIHVAEDHVLCDEHLDCNWSGPPSLLVAHKYQHVSEAAGLDTKAEDEAWVAARKRRRQERQAKIVPTPSTNSSQVSMLESFLRASMNGGSSSRRGNTGSNLVTDRRRRFGAVPKLNFYANVFEARRSEALGGSKVQQARQQQQNDKKGCRIWQEFNICESFLRTRSCKYGDNCHWSHDIKRYQEWTYNRLRTGIQVRNHTSNSSALVYMLHYKEICQYEDTVLACFRALAKNRFDLSSIRQKIAHSTMNDASPTATADTTASLEGVEESSRSASSDNASVVSADSQIDT